MLSSPGQADASIVCSALVTECGHAAALIWGSSVAGSHARRETGRRFRSAPRPLGQPAARTRISGLTPESPSPLPTLRGVSRCHRSPRRGSSPRDSTGQSHQSLSYKLPERENCWFESNTPHRPNGLVPEGLAEWQTHQSKQLAQTSTQAAHSGLTYNFLVTAVHAVTRVSGPVRSRPTALGQEQQAGLTRKDSSVAEHQPKELKVTPSKGFLAPNQAGTSLSPDPFSKVVAVSIGVLGGSSPPDSSGARATSRLYTQDSSSGRAAAYEAAGSEFKSHSCIHQAGTSLSPILFSITRVEQARGGLAPRRRMARAGVDSLAAPSAYSGRPS